MTNDLISRSALKADLLSKGIFPAVVSRAINRAPAVDAVQVVRCNECKHFNLQSMECENDAISTDNEGGASYRLNFYLDDFCSYGERRNDNVVV